MDIDVYKEWLGIPEGERPPDQYTLLRLVQFEDDAQKVRAHYKKLNAHIRKYATGAYSVRSQELLNELARSMLCLTDPERKREYDESLGREFDDAEDGVVPMERILVKQGHIDRDQMKEAQGFAEHRGLTMRDALVQMKLVPQDEWTMFSHWLIWHGRRRCNARKPECSECELAELCPRTGVKVSK